MSVPLAGPRPRAAGDRPRGANSRNNRDGFVGLGGQITEKLHGARGSVAGGELPCKSQFHFQGHEPLLGAVVEIAFEPPPRFVLNAHDAPSRLTQFRNAALEVSRQLDVAERQSHACRQLFGERQVGPVEILTGGNGQAQHSQQVTVVRDGKYGVCPGDAEAPTFVDRNGLGFTSVSGQAESCCKYPSSTVHIAAPEARGSLSERSRHGLEERIVGGGNLAREVGEHLVGRGTFSVQRCDWRPCSGAIEVAGMPPRPMR